jgi:hypothetical protein
MLLPGRAVSLMRELRQLLALAQPRNPSTISDLENGKIAGKLAV